MAVLRGRVITGVGDLSKWMRLYADHYNVATGMRLYPGSLNVLLPEPWSLPSETVALPAARVGRLVHLVPCTLFGQRCFIFRTDNAERAGPDERRVVEVVSDVKLRDMFGLSDDDVVEVVLD